MNLPQAKQSHNVKTLMYRARGFLQNLLLLLSFKSPDRRQLVYAFQATELGLVTDCIRPTFRKFSFCMI
jgi:hypothetical protein